MVATTAANTYLNSVDSGNVLRKNAYNQFGSSYTAQGQTGSFDNALQSSLANGTTQGFSGKETSGFMAAYSEYLGTKRAVSGAQQLGAWARFGGLGADTTNQLSGTLEQLGTVTNPTDIKNIAEAFTGSLKESGLSGQAKVQGQALNSVLSTMRGQQVSSREVNGVGNLLNSLGQNPRFRGEAGAQALTSLQGLFYNGTNNRFLTNAWTSSNPGKYLSAHGQAQLQEDMQNPFAHPKEMQHTINYYLRQYKDTDIAAYQLSSDSGNITRQFNKDNRKTGRRQLDRSEEDFSQSGVSSVLQQQGYTDQGNATASRTMDSTRSTINPLRSNPLVASTASSGGSILQQTAGSDKENFYLGIISQVFKSNCRVQIENLSLLKSRKIRNEILVPNTINYLVAIEDVKGLFIGEVFQAKISDSTSVSQSINRRQVDKIFPEIGINIIGYMKEDHLFTLPRFNSVGINDKVYVANKQIIQKYHDSLQIKKMKDQATLQNLASISNYPDVEFSIQPNDMFERHLLVLGATNSGKSVSSLVILDSLIQNKKKVLIIDPTGEYSESFKEITMLKS